MIGISLGESFKKQLKSSFAQFTVQYITMLLENNIQGLINIVVKTATNDFVADRWPSLTGGETSPLALDCQCESFKR